MSNDAVGTARGHRSRRIAMTGPMAGRGGRGGGGRGGFSPGGRGGRGFAPGGGRGGGGRGRDGGRGRGGGGGGRGAAGTKRQRDLADDELGEKYDGFGGGDGFADASKLRNEKFDAYYQHQGVVSGDE